MLNFSSWLVECDKSANNKCKESIAVMLEEIKKIMEFFMYKSEENRNKVLILASEQLTQSLVLLPLFIKALN